MWCDDTVDTVRWYCEMMGIGSAVRQVVSSCWWSFVGNDGKSLKQTVVVAAFWFLEIVAPVCWRVLICEVFYSVDLVKSCWQQIKQTYKSFLQQLMLNCQGGAAGAEDAAGAPCTRFKGWMLSDENTTHSMYRRTLKSYIFGYIDDHSWVPGSDWSQSAA